MHIDTPSGGKTTSGTVQDVDGMFYEHFHIAKRLYINIIDRRFNFKCYALCISSALNKVNVSFFI